METTVDTSPVTIPPGFEIESPGKPAPAAATPAIPPGWEIEAPSGQPSGPSGTPAESPQVQPPGLPHPAIVAAQVDDHAQTVARQILSQFAPPVPAPPLPRQLMGEAQQRATTPQLTPEALSSFGSSLAPGQGIEAALNLDPSGILPGAVRAIKGGKQLALGPNRVQGARELLAGGFDAATPAMAGGMLKAPLMTGLSLAGGMATQNAVEAGLKKLGMNPDWAGLLGDLTGLVGGVAAHELTPRAIAAVRAKVEPILQERAARANATASITGQVPYQPPAPNAPAPPPAAVETPTVKLKPKTATVETPTTKLAPKPVAAPPAPPIPQGFEVETPTTKLTRTEKPETPEVPTKKLTRTAKPAPVETATEHRVPVSRLDAADGDISAAYSADKIAQGKKRGVRKAASVEGDHNMSRAAYVGTGETPASSMSRLSAAALLKAAKRDAVDATGFDVKTQAGRNQLARAINHKALVKAALAKGLPVPENVMVSYPDLATAPATKLVTPQAGPRKEAVAAVDEGQSKGAHTSGANSVAIPNPEPLGEVRTGGGEAAPGGGPVTGSTPVGGPANDEGVQPLPGRGTGGGSGTGTDAGDLDVTTSTTPRPPRRTPRSADTRPRLTGYRITAADYLGEGTPQEKALANLDAIRAMKLVESEARPATLDEQRKLVKYTGWGALSNMFEYYQASPWERAAHAELKELLTPEEWKTAAATTPNAHYTSLSVIQGMWGAVERLGIKAGASILEPSMGSGNFFGLIRTR